MNALSTAVPVAPIEADHLLILLLQLALLLLGALLLGRLAIRLGMPAVVDELCVGILLGPTLLGHVSPAVADWLVPQSTEQFHLLDAIGQVGVLLLVGIAGVELDFGMVQATPGGGDPWGVDVAPVEQAHAADPRLWLAGGCRIASATRRAPDWRTRRSSV